MEAGYAFGPIFRLDRADRMQVAQLAAKLGSRPRARGLPRRDARGFDRVTLTRLDSRTHLPRAKSSITLGLQRARCHCCSPPRSRLTFF